MILRKVNARSEAVVRLKVRGPTAEATGLHPFFICVGMEEEPYRIRRVAVPYDAVYPDVADKSRFSVIARRASNGFFRLPRVRVGLPQTFVGASILDSSIPTAVDRRPGRSPAIPATH